MLYMGLGYIAAGIGAGLCVYGGASAIARLSSAALEGTARQPEAGGALRTSMLMTAGMIEGLGLLALVICFMMVLALNGAIKSKSVSPNAPTEAVQSH